MPELIRDYPIFVMSPPFGLNANSPNNAFMKELPPAERKVDRQNALKQWLEVYHYLSANSMVPLLAQAGGLQDQSYVANLGIVLTHLYNMPIVVSNYAAKERVGEAVVGRPFLESLQAGPVTQCPFLFEGEADLKRIKDNTYAIGLGMRTEAKSAVWFSREFNMRIIPIQMTNEYAYHLDCLLFAIDGEKMMVGVEDITPEEVKDLEKVTSIVPVPKVLVPPGATNLVRCNRMLLCSTPLWALQRTDEKYAVEKAKVEFVTDVAADNRLEPVFFNLSEFEKSGAGLSCLIMHLTTPKFADN